MKNIFRKLLVMGLVATSVVGLSACGAKQDEEDQNKYYIEGLDAAYALKEEFVVIGKTLNIPLEDGTTKSITVTPEMVKQFPDTLTVGEQTLIIEYEGVEYKFVIEILDTVESLQFSGQMEWLQNTEFNPSMVDMEITWASDGAVEIRSLTEDMIVEMPDMRILGQQTIAVEFEGEEYQFTITVI